MNINAEQAGTMGGRGRGELDRNNCKYFCQKAEKILKEQIDVEGKLIQLAMILLSAVLDGM